ncbi:MAG: alpha/beta hydrolase family protein, partial [Methanococcaceae archaeon]
EEVVFVNKNAKDIKLAGTLTIPEKVKNPPAVILISGSGPQDRNEKIFEHEPFFVLADYLTRQGIAVLRYDDRGIAKSEGEFKSATSYDFSTDAEAALEFLRTRTDIDINKIGLIGHSEGGMIAPMVASRNKNTAFIILLAAPGVTIDKLMMKQTEDIALGRNIPAEEIQNMLKMNKAVYAAIRGTEDEITTENKLKDVLAKNNFAGGNKEASDSFIKSMLSPWFSYFIRFTPEVYLQKVKCPVLALNGDLDKQVDATMNLEAIREVLKRENNPDFSLQYLHGLNHLFQEAKTGSETEYAFIEQTMSPQVLEAIGSWIHKRF